VEQQLALAGSSVLVAGVGGVGGATATYLAAAGVGRLVLVHPGVLEEPDLNRQTLMRPDHVGRSRVECAAETLRQHHADVQVVAHDCGIDDDRLPALVAAADLVIDARHNFPERFALNRLCVDAGVPLVVAAMSGTEAQLLVVDQGGPCLRCVFSDGDPAWQPLGFPVLGAVAGAVGCLAALEAIKLLGRFGRPATGQLVHLDLDELGLRAFRVVRDPDCPDCADTRAAGRAPSHLAPALAE
jgi:molybdopterin/thiamine biosynthesis adenylyltransferase